MITITLTEEQARVAALALRISRLDMARYAKNAPAAPDHLRDALREAEVCGEVVDAINDAGKASAPRHDGCAWEDCEYQAVYCEAHALEFADVYDEHEARKMRERIDRLERELGNTLKEVQRLRSLRERLSVMVRDEEREA